ncbi:hypothetical protein JST97_12780 [bacterium]|nr:hypothetical protein [bacterium]
MGKPEIWPVRRYLALFLFGILATLPYWSCYQDMDDEAVTVIGIVRLLNGELPYRDWATHHPTGTFFVCLPIFWLFGASGLTTRACMGLVSSLTGLVLKAIGERAGLGWYSYLPWLVWTCSGLFEKPQLNYHWFGALSSLCTIWLALRWAQPEHQTRTPLLLGASASLSLWFLQTNGATSWLAVALIWLRLRPPGLAKLAGTYLTVQLLLWLPWVGLAPQVWQNHVGIIGRHLQFNRVGYSWSPLLDMLHTYVGMGWSQPWMSLSAWTYLVHLWVQYGLFYLIILVHLIWAEKHRRPANLALAYSCLAWALTTGYCQNPTYLSYCAPACWLALASLLKAASARRLSAGWMLLEMTGWTLRAITMSWIFANPCSTRNGGYYCADAVEASELNQIHGFIQQFCPPQSQILAYPYLARLYTTEQLKNPIEDPILVPWLWGESTFRDCARRLDEQRVPFIFYRPLNAELIHAEYPAVPTEQFQVEYDRDWAIVSEHYQKIWDGQLYQIWRRRD